jgi:hypothetical protein
MRPFIGRRQSFQLVLDGIDSNGQRVTKKMFWCRENFSTVAILPRRAWKHREVGAPCACSGNTNDTTHIILQENTG